MSEAAKVNAEQQQQFPVDPLPAKPRWGCSGFIGLMILLLTILLVLFFLVFKPKLEERGVDVDSHMQKMQEKAADISADLLIKTREGAQKAVAGAEKLAERSAEKAAEAAEAGEKLAGEVKDEALILKDKAAEKAADLKEKAEEKIESWY